MPAETTAIDEASRRWDDFQGGRPIVLPDGQTWHFYEPAACVRSGRPGWTFGPDVPDDVDAILSHRFGRLVRKWSRAQNKDDQASAMLEAAFYLLARNYALTLEEFEPIMLRASEWDADNQAALGEALAVLIGTACARSTGLMEATL